MHSWDSHRKDKAGVFYTVCSPPGLHWRLTSGLKRKEMGMLKAGCEFRLLLKTAEGGFLVGKRTGGIHTCLLLPFILTG